MWIVNNAILAAPLMDFLRLALVAIKTLPSMLAHLAQPASLVILLMPGHLRNSISRIPSRELKKAETVLTMAALPAEIVIPPRYFSRVVSPATKETTLKMKAAKVTTMIK